MKNPKETPNPDQLKPQGKNVGKIKSQDQERKGQGPTRESDGQGRKREH